MFDKAWKIVIAILLFLFVWFLLSNIGLGQHSSEWVKYTGQGLLVFIGASLAFYFNALENKKNETKKNVAAANLIQFQLLTWLNISNDLYREFIAKHEDSPIRHINIRPGSPIENSLSEIDFNSISFVFNSKNDITLNLPGYLKINQSNFMNVVYTFEERNDFYLTVIQPLLREHGVNSGGGSFEYRDFKRMVGANNDHILKLITDDFIDSVNILFDSTNKLIPIFQRQVKQLLPNENIIGVGKVVKGEKGQPLE